MFLQLFSSFHIFLASNLDHCANPRIKRVFHSFDSHGKDERITNVLISGVDINESPESVASPGQRTIFGAGVLVRFLFWPLSGPPQAFQRERNEVEKRCQRRNKKAHW